MRALRLVVDKFLRGKTTLCGRSISEVQAKYEFEVSEKILEIEDGVDGIGLRSRIAALDRRAEVAALPFHLYISAVSPVVEGIDKSLVRLGCVVAARDGQAEFSTDFLVWNRNGEVTLVSGGNSDFGNIHTYVFFGPELELRPTGEEN